MYRILVQYKILSKAGKDETLTTLILLFVCFLIEVCPKVNMIYTSNRFKFLFFSYHCSWSGFFGHVIFSTAQPC